MLRDAAVKNWEELEDGTVKVNLEDGRSMEADVLVGADGIWSTIRSQVRAASSRRTRERRE